MNKIIIVWLTIFAVSATAFFLIAVVVSIRGFYDLRELLTHPGNETEKESQNEENRHDG